MKNGHFYFLSDEYCERFKKYGVMSNKENGRKRPSYYLMTDSNIKDLYWMIPISSKIDKYEKIYKDKLKKYDIRSYSGIEFGYVRGRKAAFLIQNVCPVLDEHIVEEYMNEDTGKPILISDKMQSKVFWKSRQLISLTKLGNRCTITDIHKILGELGIDVNGEK